MPSCNAGSLAEEAPQWALDMENRLIHSRQWKSFATQVVLHNVAIRRKQQNEWAVPRLHNILCADGEPLTPLSLPLPILPMPTIPPAPASGTAVDSPPPLPSVDVVIPKAHPLFPANKRALRALSGVDLTTLLAAYNCAVPRGIAARRKAFARHIGVTL
ncbi:hypothetical protein B0H19DRAFT_1232373 [Mycena capillaripes]|nr:hypothetical protein B0H19DRAFT_1232373 [Mycena capillaripes]